MSLTILHCFEGCISEIVGAIAFGNVTVAHTKLFISSLV